MIRSVSLVSRSEAWMPAVNNQMIDALSTHNCLGLIQIYFSLSLNIKLITRLEWYIYYCMSKLHSQLTLPTGKNPEWVWRCCPYGLTPCRLVGSCQRFFRAEDGPEDGDSKCLQKFDIYLRVFTASQPRRPTSSYSLPWEPQISRSGLGVFVCIWRTKNIRLILYIVTLVK
jgi:hypothetical protein